MNEKQIQIPNQIDCEPNIIIDKEVQNKTIDFDLYIIFLVKDKNEINYIANTTPCLFDIDKRPYLGIITVNSEYFKLYTENAFYAYNILFHELLHLLGFSQETLKKHPKGYHSFIQDFSSGISNSKIIQLETLQEARKHFNCSSLNGISLENQGNSFSTSHYEQILLGNELMNPGFSINPIFSRITGTLIKSTGWYDVDLNYTQPLYFGKDKGCEFIDKCDSNNTEFCKTEQEMVCSYDYERKQLCQKTSYSSNCLIKKDQIGFSCRRNYSNLSTLENEYFGQNSRCYKVVVKQKQQAGCLESKCENNIVIFIYNKKEYKCEKKDINYEINQDLIIRCPDPDDFCKKNNLQKCKNDCNGKGQCLENGKCFCDYYYSGEDCKSYNGCNADTFVCMDIMKNYYDKPFSKIIKNIINILLIFLYQIILCYLKKMTTNKNKCIKNKMILKHIQQSHDVSSI